MWVMLWVAGDIFTTAKPLTWLKLRDKAEFPMDLLVLYETALSSTDSTGVLRLLNWNRTFSCIV